MGIVFNICHAYIHQQMDHECELFLQSLNETRTSMKTLEETLTYKDNTTI